MLGAGAVKVSSDDNHQAIRPDCRPALVKEKSVKIAHLRIGTA